MIRHGIQLLFFIFDSSTISYVHITYFGHFYSYYRLSCLTSAPLNCFSTNPLSLSRLLLCLFCDPPRFSTVLCMSLGRGCIFFYGAWQLPIRAFLRKAAQPLLGNSLGSRTEETTSWWSRLLHFCKGFPFAGSERSNILHLS